MRRQFSGSAPVRCAFGVWLGPRVHQRHDDMLRAQISGIMMSRVKEKPTPCDGLHAATMLLQWGWRAAETATCPVGGGWANGRAPGDGWCVWCVFARVCVCVLARVCVPVWLTVCDSR